MLMHATTMVDARHPLAKMAKEITGLSKKTDADLERLDRIAWEGSIYARTVGEHRVPVVPAMNVLRMWQGGGTLFKKGTTIERSLALMEHEFPLVFEHSAVCTGKDGWKQLYDIVDDDGEKIYVDRRVVNGDPSKGQKGPRVIRCRPIFPEWQVSISFAFEDDAINETDLLRALEYSANLRGLSDYRPHYGKFTIEGWEVG